MAAVASVAALLLSTALLLLGNGLQGTLIPLRAEVEAFSPTMIGAMGSAYFAGFMAGCAYGARLIRRAGHIRSLAALTALASAVSVVPPMWIDPYAWIGARVVTGFCMAGLYMVIESWLNERATNHNRGRLLSIYTFVNLSSIALGQQLLRVADPAEFILFSLVSILISIASVPVAMTLAPAPKPVTSSGLRLGWLYRISPVGLIGCLIVGLANGAFWGLSPVYARVIGLDVGETANFLTLAIIAGALIQWPLGWLSDKVDRRWIIAGASLMTILASAALVASQIWGNGGVTLVFVSGSLFGMFAFPIYALCMAHANDHGHGGDFVDLSSGLLLVYGSGAVLGPALASAVMAEAGGIGLFMFTGAVHVLLVGYTLLRIRQRAPVPAGEKEDFVSVPRSPGISMLDPRAAAAEQAAAKDSDEPA